MKDINVYIKETYELAQKIKIPPIDWQKFLIKKRKNKWISKQKH